MVCANTTSTRVSEEVATIDRVQGRAVRPALLTVHDVAEMLSCSPRTVYRLNDAGRMPKPVRLGSLVRWPKAIVERWIDQGCPRPEEVM